MHPHLRLKLLLQLRLLLSHEIQILEILELLHQLLQQRLIYALAATFLDMVQSFVIKN